MSLIVADLKTAMLDSTYGIGNADDALTALGDSIRDYVLANLEISYTWPAAFAGPPPVPDLTTSAIGSLAGFPLDLLPVKSVGGTAPPAGILVIKTALIAALTTSTYSIDNNPISIWTVTPGSMATSPSLALLNLTSIRGSTTREEAYQAMADGIVTWLKLQMPIGPIAGTRVDVPPVLIYTTIPPLAMVDGIS